MSFEELLADQLLVRFRVVWMKFVIAADCTFLLPSGKDAEKPQLKSFPLTSEHFSVPPPRYVWWWFSSDWALDVNIRSNHSQLALRRLCQPLWLLWEMLSRAVLVWVKTTSDPCVNSPLWAKNNHTNKYMRNWCLVLTYLPLLHQSSALPLQQSSRLCTCISHRPSLPQQIWSAAFHGGQPYSLEPSCRPFSSILPSEWDYDMKQRPFLSRRGREQWW